MHDDAAGHGGRPGAGRGRGRNVPLHDLVGFVPLGDPVTRLQVDRYLDTAPAGGALAGLGLRARLRESDGTVVLAIKDRGTSADGITVRLELEGPASADLDPRAWPPSPAAERLMDATGGHPLQVLGAIRQTRLQRHYGRGNVEVELSLDDLEALDGDEVVGRRTELEAELVHGPRAGLVDLGMALERLPGLAPALGPKLRFALEAIVAARATG